MHRTVSQNPKLELITMDPNVFLRSIMLRHKSRHAFEPCTKVHLAHAIILLTLSTCSNSVITPLGLHQTLKALV
ncbi:hypothetical protein BpHYR1_001079 [Brachionus plicatilis]|uniref:Uncharacterized protein n=1 Tax=Brachionus plicatilis TaxID=10195 RepID=A0A3M7S6B2_BRAPC|nr:hypothetical protein BpHYR1_001079 [Brachionus plicatilis]